MSSIQGDHRRSDPTDGGNLEPVRRYPMRLKLAYLMAAFSVACKPEHARVTDSASATTNSDRRPATAIAGQGTGVCPTPAGGLRLGVDSVAGMPANLSIAALRKLCASARVDTLDEPGFSTQALRFDFRGGTIWAVQNIPDTDTLVVSKPAQSWEAVGDSLRFPDGRLIPRRLGQIRAADSVGFMSIDYGDDNSGAGVTLCRVPDLVFLLDTLPAPADTTTRPFAGIGVADTTSYRSVAVQADTLIRLTARQSCKRVAERSMR